MNEKMKKSLLLFLEIAGMTIFYGVLNSGGADKYILVMVIGLMILWFCRTKVYKFDYYFYLMIPVALYCGLGLILSFFGGTRTLWTLKTVSFWVLPPVFTYVLGLAYEKDRYHMVDVQFYGAMIYYCVTNWREILAVGSFESTFAFVFGLFSIYYAYRHRWGCMLMAVGLMYVADKRIATLAVVACLLLMVVMKLLKYSKKIIYVFWGFWSMAVATYLYSICSGFFAVLCERYHIDTNTRLDVYLLVAEQIPDKYMFGKGLGTANEMLAGLLDPETFQRWFNNPHNDFLKIYVELGAIGLFLILMSYFFVYYFVGKKVKQQSLSQLFVVTIYFMMLMTTDNVSIYILFLIPMYSICLALTAEQDNV